MSVREEIVERLRSLDPSRRDITVDELLKLLLADPDLALPEEIKTQIEALLAEANDAEQSGSNDG